MSVRKSDYYTPEWRALQARVIADANYICRDCGWPAVVAHHLTYEFGVVCSPQYLVALCEKCHKCRHGLSNWRPEHKINYMRRLGWVPAPTPAGMPGCTFELGYGLGGGVPWMREMRPITVGPEANRRRYFVTIDGRVWDDKRQKFLAAYLRDGKYLSVCLAGGAKGKLYIVHRLVAAAFIPNPDESPEVNHKNGRKTDNSVDNLEWCSSSDNHKHAFASGIRGHTEKMRETSRRNVRKAHLATRKFTPDIVARMKALHIRGMTQRKIAEIYDTHQSQVSRAIRGENYKDLIDG